MNEIIDFILGYKDVAFETCVNIILAVLIFFVGKYFATLIRRMIVSLMKKRKIDVIVITFMSNMLFAILICLVIVASLGQLGIKTASLVAVIGAAGLAIGLALQGSLSNFAAGVIMVIFRPFKVGDYVEAAKISGTIDEISIFFTYLHTTDNKKIIVPNALIIKEAITNFSHYDKRRMDLILKIPYGTDLTVINSVLLGITKDSEYVLSEPEPVLGVFELSDSNINYLFRIWVNNNDFWTAKFKLQEMITNQFESMNLAKPYNKLDLFIKNDTN